MALEVFEVEDFVWEICLVDGDVWICLPYNCLAIALVCCCDRRVVRCSCCFAKPW